MGKKQTLLRILFGQSIILIILIVLLDIFLWVFFPISLKTQSYEIVKYQDVPGLKRKIVYKSKKYRLRSLSAIDNDKPKNLIRILCFGASTTDQSTQETQDTWSGILETKLKKQFEHSDFRIQTMGFGGGGLRASDNAFWIREMFEKIQPDIVITLLGINDLAWNGGENYSYNNIEESFSKKEQLRERSIKNICKKYSQICRRTVSIKQNLKTKKSIREGKAVVWGAERLRKLNDIYRAKQYVQNPVRNLDPIIEFRDSINWMVAFLKKRNVEIILLGQPVLWKESLNDSELGRLWFWINTSNGPVRPSGRWLNREMARYNLAQQSIATMSSIIYLNLDNKIPKTLDYYYDDCHYTDLGSMAVADAILPTLVPVVEDVIIKKSN